MKAKSKYLFYNNQNLEMDRLKNLHLALIWHTWQDKGHYITFQNIKSYVASSTTTGHGRICCEKQLMMRQQNDIVERVRKHSFVSQMTSMMSSIFLFQNKILTHWSWARR